MDKLISAAMDEGFAAAAVVDTDQIVFDPSFRPYCAENLCGQYGANYSCPPDCGTPEEMKNRILAHKKALVVQTAWELESFSDTETIRKAKKEHNAAQLRLAEKMKQLGHPGLMVGASGCALCSPCALTKGQPCAFPDRRYSCMSAYCIFVKKLAEECNMDYTWDNGILGLFGLFAFD